MIQIYKLYVSFTPLSNNIADVNIWAEYFIDAGLLNDHLFKN